MNTPWGQVRQRELRRATQLPLSRKIRLLEKERWFKQENIQKLLFAKLYNKLHAKYWKQEGKRGALYLVYDSILWIRYSRGDKPTFFLNRREK